MEVELIKKHVSENGFYHSKNVSQHFVDKIVYELGTTLFITDIIERDNGRVLNSSTDMFLHTDQPDAHYLIWHCLKQAETGGETVLMDVQLAFDYLPAKHRNALAEIQLKLDFQRGDQTHPFYDNGKFFYSPSLLLQNYSLEHQLAVAAFKTAIELAPKLIIKLEDNDFFVLDNTKFLHGRKSFKALSNRHLKRYLIADFQLA